MRLELIGILTILLGALCMRLGIRTSYIVQVSLTLLAASAAFLVGGNTIQPSYVFMVFLIGALLMHSVEAVPIVRNLQVVLNPPHPGFWFGCFVIYSVLTAFILPRMLAGATIIIPLGTSAYGAGASMVPLGPVSSNFSQSIYLISDFVCFALFAAFAATRIGFDTIARALTVFAIVNLCFVFLDIGTYYTGTQGLLGFMRNADYTMHDAGVVFGMKRIVGSFTEASFFAGITTGITAYCGTLWIAGRNAGTNFILTLLSGGAVLLSTSSTGMVGIAVIGLVLYIEAFKLAITQRRLLSGLVVVGAPSLLFFIVLFVLVNKQLAYTIWDYFNTLVLDKMNTDSGVERSNWNKVAFQNFFDTWGLGTGLGTVRTSNHFAALLSNVGVIGTLIFLVFAWTSLGQRRGKPGSYHSDVRAAARNGCICLLACALLVSPIVSLGFFFMILMAMASAEPEKQRAQAPLNVETRHPRYEARI